MEPQPHFSGSGDQSGAIACGQCGAPMPREMRFCRSCGNRLGEGSAEYTETVRLPHAKANANWQFNSQYAPGMAGSMTRETGSGYPARKKKRLGFSGMTWMWIILGIFFLGGGLMSAWVKVRSRPPGSVATVSRSVVGVDDFETTDGGVTFDVVTPPDSPADKAGLVGGDIVTSFDGRAVTDDEQMMDLLRQTPVGKTVEVIFLRDGVIKKTLMTTVSEGARNRMKGAFDARPEGKGLFGFDSDEMTRISDPMTKTFGVRIDEVTPNGPADLFGIKVGDIITDFDGVPIRTEEELLSRVRRAIPYSTVEVKVLRGPETAREIMIIPVKIGRAR